MERDHSTALPLLAEVIAFPIRPAVVTVAPPPPFQVAARALLIGILLAAPLAFGAVQEWAWGAMAVLTFLLPLLWLIAGARQGNLRIFWSPLYLPAAMFFLLIMIQFTGRLTMDPIATREAVLKLATNLILFFMAGQLIGAMAPISVPLGENGKTVRPLPWARAKSEILGGSPLRWAIVTYTFLMALFAIFQFFSSHGLIYWRVASPGWTFGPYVNHNHYAGLMEMLIPLSVASVLPALRKHASVLVLGLVILIPIAAVLLAGSRGGFISLTLEALLAAVLVSCRAPRHAHRITALVGGVMILSAALLFFWMAPPQIEERLTRMGDGARLSEVELGNRLAVSHDSLRILRDHPWMGVGLGGFETVFPRYQSFPSDAGWDHAHNDYAEALAETGATGGALVLLALGLFFFLSFRNLRERLRNSTGQMQFAAAIGCCGLLVHSFADFNLHIPANAAWFAVCAAIATSGPQVQMS